MQYWDGELWSEAGPVSYLIEDSLYNFDVVLKKSSFDGYVRDADATGWILWNGPSSDESDYLAYVFWEATDNRPREAGLVIFQECKFDLYMRTADDQLQLLEPHEPSSKLVGGLARIIGRTARAISIPEYVPELVKSRLENQADGEAIADGSGHSATQADHLATSAPTPVAESDESISRRLHKVKALNDEGTLTDDEYATKRRAIFDSQK